MSRLGNAWQACGERMPYICFALDTKMPDMRRFDGEKGTGRWRGAACEGPAPSGYSPSLSNLCKTVAKPHFVYDLQTMCVISMGSHFVSVPALQTLWITSMGPHFVHIPVLLTLRSPIFLQTTEMHLIVTVMITVLSVRCNDLSSIGVFFPEEPKELCREVCGNFGERPCPERGCITGQGSGV